MKRGILVLFITITALSGCTTVEQTMNSWMGSTKKQVILAWGPPNRVTEDGDGGEILIYERWISFGTSTSGTAQQNSSGDVNYSQRSHNDGYMRQRMFYINKEGKVYYWRAKGR